MISEAKLAANRRNAQRSTGPRTPEGKAQSARNSTLHNLRSRKPVELTAEDREAIAEIVAAFRPTVLPQTPSEEAVVLEFATARHLRSGIERAIDEAFCTNEATVLDYLERRYTAAVTRFNRAYEPFKDLVYREIAIRTNEPTISPAAPQYQSDRSVA
ncbi:MAG: hypothetical protein ABJF23_16700 [Bryobacteraceae bacterium]